MERVILPLGLPLEHKIKVSLSSALLLLLLLFIYTVDIVYLVYLFFISLFSEITFVSYEFQDFLYSIKPCCYLFLDVVLISKIDFTSLLNFRGGSFLLKFKNVQLTRHSSERLSIKYFSRILPGKNP